jgi:hypothetical protein
MTYYSFAGPRTGIEPAQFVLVPEYYANGRQYQTVEGWSAGSVCPSPRLRSD